MHLRDALLELAIRTLGKSYLPRSEGHLRVPAPIRDSQLIGGSRLSTDERAELVRLRRENRVQVMEIEILKRARVYFARGNVLPN